MGTRNRPNQANTRAYRINHSSWRESNDDDMPSGYIPENFNENKKIAGRLKSRYSSDKVKTGLIQSKERVSHRYAWLRPVHLELIQYYASDGLSLKDISLKTGIPYSEMKDIAKYDQDVADAIQFGKDRMVARVESALIKTALGMRCSEYKKTTYFNEKGVETSSKIEEREYDLPPSVEAIKVILFARAKDRYNKDMTPTYEDRSINITIRKADGSVNMIEQEPIPLLHAE